MSFFKKIRRNDFSKKRSSKDFSEQPKYGSPEFIICGLGNPGTRYENTRHNCGYMVLDTLARDFDFKLKKLKFKSLTSLETIDGVKCFLMKPTTYMNLSGEALTAAMEFYKIKPENTIVIFDDFAIPFGSLKIRKSGSDGGHNGMKNIILQANSDEFPRIKVGIGSPPHSEYSVKEWVLSPFKKDEGVTLETSLEKAAAAVRMMIKGETDKAMNEYNRKI
ncbi:MAG: aminoacyl-tRNA hydrolase [Oscillospiraceae bacterium]|nr:aminoacyl-tRNA hydrolase [Oscillospiraceae bacterium]